MGSFDDRMAVRFRGILWNEERVHRELTRLAESRRLYSDAAGDPVLKESYVVYLDTLGTKARIGALDDPALRDELELLLRFRWFLHEDERDNYQRFLSFTDNVVVGTPVVVGRWGEQGYGLGSLLDSVGGYQMNMTARGGFLRGGVSRGQLYMDDRFVTGSALVDAVTLEQEIATYPRVILSEKCAGVVMAIRDDWGWDDALLVDADGFIFVNYLKVIDADEMPGQVESGLSAHRDIIETRLSEFSESSRVREKYRWAADYHNFVSVEFFDNRDFLITDKLSTLERAFPRQFRRLP